MKKAIAILALLIYVLNFMAKEKEINLSNEYTAKLKHIGVTFTKNKGQDTTKINSHAPICCLEGWQAICVSFKNMWCKLPSIQSGRWKEV